jgi:hypothetical protein
VRGSITDQELVQSTTRREKWSEVLSEIEKEKPHGGGCHHAVCENINEWPFYHHSRRIGRAGVRRTRTGTGTGFGVGAKRESIRSSRRSINEGCFEFVIAMAPTC